MVLSFSRPHAGSLLSTEGRGRDDPYGPPRTDPACGTTAPGSCLGSDAQAPKMPAVRGKAPVTGDPGTGSGSCFALPRSPWPAPFPPPSPPVPRSNLCSEGFFGTMKAVRLPTPVHHGRAPGSPCGLGQTHQARGRASQVPHSVSAHARGLRPRRVRLPLANTRLTVWPSACSERVGTQE